MSSRSPSWKDVSAFPFLASMALTFLMSPQWRVAAAPPAGSTSDNAAMARPVSPSPTVPPPTTPNINAIPTTPTGTPNSVSNPTSGAIKTGRGVRANPNAATGTSLPNTYGNNSGNGTAYDAQRNLGTAADTSLSQQVRTSLNAGGVSPESARGIQVQTVNGVVTLSGTVSSQAEADRAAAAARSASGKDVTNNIRVQSK